MTDTPPELPPLDRDALAKSMAQAFNFGQTYWAQADSDSYRQNAKADATLDKFRALIDETVAAFDSVCALAARPAAVAVEPTDADLRLAWRKAGGKFHGPDVETGVMPEEKLLPFLRTLAAPPQDARDAALLDGIEKCEVRDGWVIAKNVGSFTAHFGRGQHATRKTLREAISAALTKEQP